MVLGLVSSRSAVISGKAWVIGSFRVPRCLADTWLGPGRVAMLRISSLDLLSVASGPSLACRRIVEASSDRSNCIVVVHNHGRYW